MPIEWRDEMSVGSKVIDTDHQELIDLINIFEKSMEAFENKDNIVAALKQLEEYSQRHFEKEEMFQELIEYPDLEKHRISHQQLVAELSDFITKLSEKDMVLNDEANRDQFVEFVRHWLIDHVIKEDLLFKPYAKRAKG